MGYDVSFHPISPDEIQEWHFTPLTWIQQGQEEKVLALAMQHGIEDFYAEKYLDTLRVGAETEPDELFDKSHGFYIAVIQGFFRDYYYTRGSAFSFLAEEKPEYARYFTPWAQVVPTALPNPAKNQIIENYCSGVYLSPNQVLQILRDLEQEPKVLEDLEKHWSDGQFAVLKKALTAAAELGTGLLEATEVVEPNPLHPNESTCYSNLFHCDRDGVYLYIAEFKDGKCPVQLMVMKCDRFKGKGFDAFLMSQMWDCQEDRERIFRECKYQVVATDMLAAALPALERANLDADFLEALAELYPTCEAFYFQNCGKLFLAEDVRSHQIKGSDRFIRFGVNVRFFNIEGTEDMLIDTVGMSTLFLPDLQYHFHGMDPNWVVNHAYNVASYILEHDNPIQDGETIDGVADGQMCREIQWKCQYEDALIQPPREVLDIHMGNYASGGR